MDKLAVVAFRCQIDAQRLRALIIRGEIAGERRGVHWYADAASARAWKARQGQKPATASVTA